MKLDVPSFFVEQVLRNEPVPEHVLDIIERKVCPIRFIDHASEFLNVGSLRKPGDTLKTETESEITLKEFVRNCGGLLAASLKLGVSTSTLQKILSGLPVSAPTAKKTFAALKANGWSIASEPYGSPISRLHGSPETAGLHHSSTQRQGVYPSTIRKIQEGLPISHAPNENWVFAVADTTLSTPDHVRTNPFSALASKLREIVKSDVDMFDLASKWGVTETSLRKIYEGKTVTRALIKKVEAALCRPDPKELFTKPSAAIERLRTIHELYEQLGTLEAVGKQVGLTRERVRQLLAKGKNIGLFEYNPHEYPYVSKEKLIGDYVQSPNLGYVAKVNQIPQGYLRKLLTAYSITELQLASYRKEARRSKCVEQYKQLVAKAGHHLTTTELQSTREGHALNSRIIRLWGTTDSFRSALDIPIPAKGSASFREDTRKWREQKQQVAFVRRMQQLDHLREYFHSHGSVGTSQIAVECGTTQARAHHLLSLLVKSGEVQKIGQSLATKYMLIHN